MTAAMTTARSLCLAPTSRCRRRKRRWSRSWRSWWAWHGSRSNWRKLCKELTLDVKRRQEVRQAHDDSIRTWYRGQHMIFTGSRGVGKSTVARLVARLFHQLGLNSTDKVVVCVFLIGPDPELTHGPNYNISTISNKTVSKIKEAKGGVLYVNEAHQLAARMMRGQNDYSDVAVGELMQAMSDSKVRGELQPGRSNAKTLIFAGPKKETEECFAYYGGLEIGIRHHLHFDDYSVDELCAIVHLKVGAAGYRMSDEAKEACGASLIKRRRRNSAPCTMAASLTSCCSGRPTR